MVVAMFLGMWGELVTDFGTRLVIEHMAMLSSMLVVMFLRRDEYACGTHGPHTALTRRRRRSRRDGRPI